MNLAYEWGRLIWWLGQGQNAAAVQAISAVATVGLTIILAFATWRSTRLTGRMQDIMYRQLAVSITPNVAITRSNIYFDPPVLELQVLNKGELPVRIMGVKVDFPTGKFWVEGVVGRVIPGGGDISFRQKMPAQIKKYTSLPSGGVDITMDIEDLAGVMRHQFVHDTQGMLTHRTLPPQTLSDKVRWSIAMGVVNICASVYAHIYCRYKMWRGEW